MSGEAERGASERFLLGVNYWPRTSAMAMWRHFDAGEIDEDFARIAELGFDAVRFFLMWEAFQPAYDATDAAALARFETVLASAERRGLRTMPTLFTGHMSGVNWLPAWSLDAARPAARFRTIASGGESPFGIGDFYRGPLLEAQSRFARAVGERARRHPAILAWDLGNEFSNLREPESPGDAASWSATLTADLEQSSAHAVTGGTHGEDLTRDRRIRLSSICEPWAFATMHGYPVYSAFARGPADPEVVPFLAALTRTFSREPVLFSEFGNPTCADGLHGGGTMGCLDEDAMALYATAVLERLAARGARGAFWWCWADYAHDLATTPPFDRAPHELHFGIVRNDGSEKPVARALADFARRRCATSHTTDTLATNEQRYYEGLPGSTAREFAAYLAAHGADAAMRTQ